MLESNSYASENVMRQKITNDAIDKLMESMDSYKNLFIVNNELIEHTWKNPYPKMYIENKIDKSEDIKEINNKELTNYKIIKENLTCFISKLNYIDYKSILLGYPIKINSYS